MTNRPDFRYVVRTHNFQYCWQKAMQRPLDLDRDDLKIIAAEDPEAAEYAFTLYRNAIDNRADRRPSPVVRVKRPEPLPEYEKRSCTSRNPCGRTTGKPAWKIHVSMIWRTGLPVASSSESHKSVVSVLSSL